MFSEVIHEIYVKEYEEILLKGIKQYEEKGENDEEAVGIVNFLKNHVYPKYESTLGDAWTVKVSENQKKIDEFYKPK